MKSFLAFVGLLLALSGVLATAPFFDDVQDSIDNEFIVVLHSNITLDQRDAVVSLVERQGGVILSTYSTVLKGFAFRMDEKLVKILLEHPLVKFIERNARVSIDECISDIKPGSWGLSRISASGPRAVDLFQYDPRNGGDGEGETAYIIDTGIQVTHHEFEGRAEFGFMAKEFYPDEPETDCNGHGTHVAGTVGGKTYGVARKSLLVGVKVLGCAGSGSLAGVISGIDWSAADCQARKPKKDLDEKKNRCVANMSLGGGKSAVENEAVEGAVEEGIIMCVAGGNENNDACTKSPASAPSAITVGSTTFETNGIQNVDVRSPFSNYGPCLDLFAPGQAITSAWIDSPGEPKDEAIATISGTSMASPHVAGVAVQFLKNDGDQNTPAKDFAGILIENADKDLIRLDCETAGNFFNKAGQIEICKDSPNLLLQSLHCEP